jgi:hypothetical protein
MSQEFVSDLKSDRRSRAIDHLAKRFGFTVAMTLLIVLLNKESLDKDPNSLKWLLVTVWVDVFAYLVGFLRGYAAGAKAVALRLLNVEDDIIGGKGDRHEE